MNVIYILWLRQLKGYIRTKSRIIGSLGQPILFLVALGFGFGPVYAKAGGGDYMQFLAPGVIAMTIMFTAVFTGMEIIWDKQFGFLKETLVAPVPRVLIMLGRTFGGATVSMIQGIIVFLVTLAIGFRPESWTLILPAFLAMFLIAMLFSAFGTAIASMLDDMQSFPLIMNFIIMPLFFLSGALFPPVGIPKALEIIIKINPLSYGVDALRGSLSGVAQFGFTLDFTVLVVLTGVITVIGAWLFTKIEA